VDSPTDPTTAADLGRYCRRIEEHLARVNGGHLVRVVGPAFELVRHWHGEGVPLSIVLRGVEDKAARHKAGRSTRALRLEFCEPDVRAVFDEWRRAVGVSRLAEETPDAATAVEEVPDRRRPSLTRQIDRAIDKLAHAAGRLESAVDVREEASRVLDQLAALREEARHARGVEARRELAHRAAAIDRRLGALARLTAGPDVAEAEAEAAGELAPYRARLSREDWDRSVRAGVDRLLRERFSLPTLDVDVPA
jgi:hypothetical protein